MENAHFDMSPLPDFEMPQVDLGISLGYNAAANRQEVFLLPTDMRCGTLIEGVSGSGKSTLVKRMVRQKTNQGCALVVIDFHEDVAQDGIGSVPDNYMDRAYYIDFSDAEHLPVMNPLDVDVNDTLLVDRVIQECIQLLKHNVRTEFAAQRFDEMARLALKTILHPDFRYERTWIHASALYTDEKFLTSVLENIHDAQILAEWALVKRSRRDNDWDSCVHWFVSKFHELISNTTLRFIFGSEKTTFDIEELIDNESMLFFNIPESILGKSVAEFLASFIVLKIENVVMRRHSCRNIDLNNIYVFIDEFQKCASADFALLLAEARKFCCCLVLSHQNLRQLVTFDERTGYQDNHLLEAVLGNIGTFICFRMGSNDAKVFADQFDIDEKRLKHIKKYRPIVRCLFDNMPLDPIEVVIPNIVPLTEDNTSEIVRERMVDEGICLPIMPTGSAGRKGTRSSKTKENKRIAVKDITVNDYYPPDLLLNEDDSKSLFNTRFEENLKTDKELQGHLKQKSVGAPCPTIRDLNALFEENQKEIAQRQLILLLKEIERTKAREESPGL